MMMFQKLNLIVICAVILTFGECKNCDGVLKCVTTFVGDTLSPNSNVTLDYIEDSLVNISTSNESPDSLLKQLSRYLVEKISSLIKEGPVLKSIEENNKIYVQSFKFNDSASEYTPEFVKEVKPIVITEKNEHNTNAYDNTLNKTLQTTNNIIDIENALFSYNNTGKYQEKNDNRHTIIPTTIIPDNTAQKNVTDINGYNKGIQENVESTTYRLSDTTNHEKVQQKNDIIGRTTEINSAITAVLNKVIENNDSSINYLHEINNTKTQNQTSNYESVEKINIKENYIDDTNEFLISNNEIDIAEIVNGNMTDYLDIDYVDMYKDTTNEDIEYTPVVYIPTTTSSPDINSYKKPTDGVDSVYPWIATVFVMSPDSKQFEYICDGILLSKEAVLTSARCVMKNNVTVDSINILIIMGKRSLQSTGPNEKITRVKSIKLHDNFVSSEGKVDNDLAIAVLAEPVSFNIDIQPAPLGIEDKSAPIAMATTGWHFSGPLQPLYLGPQSMENSRTDDICSHLYCATLDNNETTCPSFGGLFVERHEDNQWRLKGIASGSPTSTGVCFNKKLTFTKIENYIEWIKTNIETSSK